MYIKDNEGYNQGVDKYNNYDQRQYSKCSKDNKD